MAETANLEKSTLEIIERLVKENRLLSETIDGLQKEYQLIKEEYSVMQQKTQDAITAEQRAQEQAKYAELQQQESEKIIAQLKQAIIELEGRARLLSMRVENTPLTPLTVDEGTALINRTIESVNQLGQFKVVDANITLKLATAKLGNESIFVFPEPGSVDVGMLHELKFSIRNNEQFNQ